MYDHFHLGFSSLNWSKGTYNKCMAVISCWWFCTMKLLPFDWIYWRFNFLIIIWLETNFIYVDRFHPFPVRYCMSEVIPVIYCFSFSVRHWWCLFGRSRCRISSYHLWNWETCQVCCWCCCVRDKGDKGSVYRSISRRRWKPWFLAFNGKVLATWLTLFSLYFFELPLIWIWITYMCIFL